MFAGGLRIKAVNRVNFCSSILHFRFNVVEFKDSRYAYDDEKGKDMMDTNNCGYGELCYEVQDAYDKIAPIVAGDYPDSVTRTKIKKLLEAGAKVKAYDPVAMKEAKHTLGETITYSEDQYEALIDADCLLLVTEWPEFKVPNFNIVRKLLNQPVIFDGRNIYEIAEMKQL